MEPEKYFELQQSTNKKRYDALRDFFVNKRPAEEVAKKYKYTLSAFYSLTRDFRSHLKKNRHEDFFFKDVSLGRKPNKNDDLKELIISLRKQNYSIEEIVGIAQSKSYEVSYWPVYQLLHQGASYPELRFACTGLSTCIPFGEFCRTPQKESF